MILIVGGQGAGKRDYVRSLGYPDSAIASARLDDKPVLADLHLLLRDDTVDPDALLAALLAKEVVICNEVGCGIVPLDAADRAWRDRVGRTCILLAQRADRVVRLCCGIPQVIKDGAP